MLGFSFACCVAVVALFVWLHRLHGGWSALIYVPIAFVLQFVSPAAFLVALLLGLTGCFVPRTARAETRWFAGCVATCLVFGLVWWNTQDEINELRELRAEYPIVSLNDRLTYEARSPRYIPTSAGDAREHHSETIADGNHSADIPEIPPNQLTLADEVTGNLKQFESELKRADFSFRSYQFNQLHSASYEGFVRANGFGVMRMIRVNRRSIERQTEEHAPVPQPSPLNDLPEFAESPADLEPDDTQPAATRLVDVDRSIDGLNLLHRRGRNEFLNADRFGFIESRQRAVGFQPHAFRQEVHPHGPGLPPGLQIARLELVSLLKFPTPQVYVSDFLPDMEQLQDIPTRELDGFETAALAKLWTEQDIVVEEQSGEIRMLGSLRAGKQCLKCHNVRRGDLLGAFSYRIRMPGQRPRKVLPEDRQTALHLNSRSRLHVAMTQADRY